LSSCRFINFNANILCKWFFNLFPEFLYWPYLTLTVYHAFPRHRESPSFTDSFWHSASFLHLIKAVRICLVGMKYFSLISPALKHRNRFIFDKVDMLRQFSADILVKHDLREDNQVKWLVVFVSQDDT